MTHYPPSRLALRYTPAHRIEAGLEVAMEWPIMFK